MRKFKVFTLIVLLFLVTFQAFGYRKVEVRKILDAVALEDSGDEDNIKYTLPYDITRHDFQVDVGFFVANSGASTDLDIHFQYGTLTPDGIYDIESASACTNVGLNDLSTSGTYLLTETRRYRIEVDSTGATDTYKWSSDDGTTWTEETVDMESGAVELEYGVYITFSAQTGHTSGDFWYFWATDSIWDATTTKAIDAMNCAASQKYEAETLKPCEKIRFWVDNQDGTNAAVVTLIMILATEE